MNQPGGCYSGFNITFLQVDSFARSPSSARLPFFGWEGSSTKTDYRRKKHTRVPTDSNLKLLEELVEYGRFLQVDSFRFLLVADPLKMVFPKKGSLFFQGH